VKSGVMQMMTNSGQSCNAPSRMFIPRAKNEEAKAIAKATAEAVKVQAPATAEKGAIGPVVSEAQFNKIQGLIKKGIDEGATLVAGGLGRPEGLNRGYYVRPTVFADVRNDMTIAVEEIFGPVLCMIPYDTVYGLSGYVQSANQEHAQAVARQLRTGMVHVNGAGSDQTMPFGGFKQSGNGREWGVEGIHEFLETKSVFGYATA
jgi:aldehyde dehydrogenase (NAD+)